MPNKEIMLQRVTGSGMMSLLDVFSRYNGLRRRIVTKLHSPHPGVVSKILECHFG